MAAVDLPDLSSRYRLPEATRQNFRANGHAVVRALATAEEIAVFRPAIVETGPNGRWDARPMEERDTYGKAFVQMFNLWTHDDRVRAFVHARRFARIAAELMGVEAVRLYHDQALFKEPGGGFTPWHQDQFYWPLDTPHTITMWMPLVPIGDDMGPMRFASASHHLGNLGDFPIGDASQQSFQRIVVQHRLQLAHHAPFAAGDATFHAGWTLHGAAENRSFHMREVMTVIYYADGTRVGPLDHPNRRIDRDLWLNGCEPGELAAGALNPVLYQYREG